jgi:hypothetical protein
MLDFDWSGASSSSIEMKTMFERAILYSRFSTPLPPLPLHPMPVSAEVVWPDSADSQTGGEFFYNTKARRPMVSVAGRCKTFDLGGWMSF